MPDVIVMVYAAVGASPRVRRRREILTLDRTSHFSVFCLVVVNDVSPLFNAGIEQ